MTGWYYVKKSLLAEENVGPFTGDDFLQFAQDGTIKPDTMVFHQKYTRGQWVPMSRISPARKKYEAGERQRREEAEARIQQLDAEQEERKQERERLRQEREEERQLKAAERAEALANSPFAKFLGDGQDPSVIAKAYSRISEILTPQEEIEYIAIAHHFTGFQSPDCVVATTRRFMVVRQKVLGRMDFEDYLWVDLQDARLKEGIVFSEITFRTTSAKFHKVDYLPKVQARRIYGFCQAKEEEARGLRRNMSLEDKRAAAGQVNVAVPQVAPEQSAAQPAAQSLETPDDPMQKLTKLKQMLDAGLIEQAEYDATKTRILDSM